MRRASFEWVLLCALVVTVGCRTPSPEWNGSWMLDPAKSSYQGGVLAISIAVGDEFRFDEQSIHTLRCDGKDRTVGNDRTLLCVRNGDTILDITVKENGVRTRITHDELSNDGKVLTTTVTDFRQDGSPVRSQIVFSRLSGADGFAGQWRDTSYLQQHAGMVLRLDEQALHIDYPSVGQQIDAPLDGADVPLRGTNVLEGATCAVRSAGKREFLMVTKRHGKVFTQGSMKLSNDGNTVTNYWWNPDRAADKGTLVYERR